MRKLDITWPYLT